MFETYRMLGREREAELEREAARLRPLAGRPLLRLYGRGTTDEKGTQRKERSMNIKRLIRSLRISSAVLVTAVVSMGVVGQAAAEVWPDGRDGARLSTQLSYPVADITRVLAPDDLTRALPDRSTPAPFPDFVDRYIRSHRTGVVRTISPASTPKSGEGFDWAAAGIGASTTAAFLLAFGVGIGFARRSRTRSAVA